MNQMELMDQIDSFGYTTVKCWLWRFRRTIVYLSSY